VKPVLTYGSEIWFPFQSNTNNLNWDKKLYNTAVKTEVEKCAQMLYRYCLGVGKKTSLLGIYGDTGRYPIYFELISNAVKMYHRVTQSQPNSLLYEAYRENKALSTVHKNVWLYGVEQIMEHYNIDQNVTNENHHKNQMKRLQNELGNSFEDNWKRELHNDQRPGRGHGNKMRTYRKFKHNFGCELYLKCIQNKLMKSSYSKFRLSSHKLKIETGRYIIKPKRLLPEERICDMCDSLDIEDEFHFLMKCKIYEKKRTELVEYISVHYPMFKELSDHHKFIWMMNILDEKIIQAVALFVHNSLNMRENISKPKLNAN
jgi:hypothetical protein